MNEPQYTVPKCFMDNLRLMLIRMAQTDSRPSSERKAAIERPRQFLEGFLGIDRDELAVENPATVDDVLIACGILNRNALWESGYHRGRRSHLGQHQRSDVGAGRDRRGY